MEDNTQKLYAKNVRSIVLGIFEGINALVFAYGQTCSGKTYTMLGNHQTPGIIQLALQTIFSRMEKEGKNYTYTVKYSFLEIYNEKINDLLDVESEKQVKLMAAERRQEIKMWNLKQEHGTSAKEICARIEECERNRHVRSTDFNERSSRSHCVFQLELQREDLVQKVVYNSTLTMIDLAGSERACLDPEKKKETVYINRSLLTLAQVIGKLSDRKQKHAHIPYRDSNLTRFLQPILAGATSRICLICNIKNEKKAFEESHRTIIFGQNAKNLDMKPKINVSSTERLANCTLHQQEKEELLRRIELLNKEMEESRKMQTQIFKLADEKRFLLKGISGLLAEANQLDKAQEIALENGNLKEIKVIEMLQEKFSEKEATIKELEAQLKEQKQDEGLLDDNDEAYISLMHELKQTLQDNFGPIKSE